MANRDQVYIDILTETKKSVANLAKMTAGITAAVLAVRKITAEMKQMSEAYLTQVKAEVKLSSALRATGEQLGISSGELTKMAAEMSRATGIADEMVIGAQGLMTTFTQIGKQVFPQAIEAAADMSKMFGQDLQQSVIQLGTALNDPIAGVGRLRRIGISFTESQKESIAAFVAQNDLMGAQTVILDELQAEFGGVAREMGTNAVGSSDRFKNAMVDLKEEGGRAIQNFFAPLREQVTEIVNRFLEAKRATREFMDVIEESTVTPENLLGVSEKEYAKLVDAIDLTIQRVVSLRNVGVTESKAQAQALEDVADAYETNIDLIFKVAKAEGLVTDELIRHNKTLEEMIVRAEHEAQIDALLAERKKRRQEELSRLAALQTQATAIQDEYNTEIEKAIRLEDLLGDAFDETNAKVAAAESAMDALLDVEGDHSVQLVQLAEDIKEYTRLQKLRADADLDAAEASLALVQIDRMSEIEELQALRAEHKKYGSMLAEDTDRLNELENKYREYNAGLEFANALIESMRERIEGTSEAMDGMSGHISDGIELWKEVEITMTKLLDSGVEDYMAAIGATFVDINKGANKAEDAIKGFVSTALRAFGRYLLTAEAVGAVSALLGGNISGGVAAVIAGAGAATAFAAAGAVEAMADGGIVTRPTLALVGESGPEAVIPLNKGRMGGDIHVHINAGIMTTQMKATQWVASIARATR